MSAGLSERCARRGGRCSKVERPQLSEPISQRLSISAGVKSSPETTRAKVKRLKMPWPTSSVSSTPSAIEPLRARPRRGRSGRRTTRRPSGAWSGSSASRCIRFDQRGAAARPRRARRRSRPARAAPGSPPTSRPAGRARGDGRGGPCARPIVLARRARSAALGEPLGGGRSLALAERAQPVALGLGQGDDAGRGVGDGLAVAEEVDAHRRVQPALSPRGGRDELGAQVDEPALERLPHLGADEELVGDLAEDAAVAQLVDLLLADPRGPLAVLAGGDHLEPRLERPGRAGILVRRDVQAPLLVGDARARRRGRGPPGRTPRPARRRPRGSRGSWRARGRSRRPSSASDRRRSRAPRRRRSATGTSISALRPRPSSQLAVDLVADQLDRPRHRHEERLELGLQARVLVAAGVGDRVEAARAAVGVLPLPLDQARATRARAAAGTSCSD